jgi:outer membrane protein
MLKKIFLLLMLVLPMSVFAQKFGHIKTQEILTVMPEYTKAQTDIDTMRQQYENEFKIVQEDFQKKFTAFQQEQANLPKNILERRQNELEQLNQRAMQMRQDAQQELEKSWFEMLEPIAKKIDDAIKAVGQEGGYVYIFDLNSTQIPFISDTHSTDVTGIVKAKLGLQ